MIFQHIRHNSKTLCFLTGMSNIKKLHYLVFLSFTSTFALILWWTSANISVPVNTMIVPIQWAKVNGFWKYIIENNKEKNFLSVITKVTVKDAHSVVSMYTLLMHIYCVTTLSNKKPHNSGTPAFKKGTWKVSLFVALLACSIKLEEYIRNPGSE